MRFRKDPGYSYDPDKAISWAVELVQAYTASVNGQVKLEIDALMDAIAGDEAELRKLLRALAGLAGQAVMTLAVQLEADPEPGQDLAEREKRLRQRREEILSVCAAAFREGRPARIELRSVPSATGIAVWAALRGERRSGFDRRLASERRRHVAGDPVEMVNLRLYGERRSGVTDRRSGTDRRRTALAPPR